MQKISAIIKGYLGRTDIIGVVFAYLVLISVVLYALLIAPADKAGAVSISHQYPAVPESSPQARSGVPININIERLGLSKSIVNSNYINSTAQWQIEEDQVNYAINTYPANDQKGVTFLFGHNTYGVLASTAELVKGDIATITTQDGDKFNYSYQYSEIISPTDVSLFDNLDSELPILKLMTCSGAWSQDRRMMTFSYEGGS